MKEELLISEIKTLKRASKIFMNVSLKQYKRVLKLLSELEKDKKLLEKKVEERTKHLKQEIEYNIELTNRLEKLAHFDELTNLLNRRRLIEKLNILKELDKKFTILFIDLDGFKPINDIYGHKVGDEVLKIVSKRLLNSVKHTDLVARFGGDEFIVVLVDLVDEKKALEISNDILKKIDREIVINDKKLKIGASIGVYISINDSVEDALKKADIAMYKAKEGGKNRVVLYSKELDKIQTLINKIENETLEFELIPIIDSISEKICGYDFEIDIEEEILDSKVIEKLNLYKLKKLKELNLNSKIHFSFPLSLINEKNVKMLLELKIDGCIGFDSFKFSDYQLELLNRLKSKYTLGLNSFKEYSIKPFIEYPIEILKLEKSTFLKAPEFFEKFFVDLRVLNVVVVIKSKEILVRGENIFYEI